MQLGLTLKALKKSGHVAALRSLLKLDKGIYVKATK